MKIDNSCRKLENTVVCSRQESMWWCCTTYRSCWDPRICDRERLPDREDSLWSIPDAFCSPGDSLPTSSGGWLPMATRTTVTCLSELRDVAARSAASSAADAHRDLRSRKARVALSFTIRIRFNRCFYILIVFLSLGLFSLSFRSVVAELHSGSDMCLCRRNIFQSSLDLRFL